MCCRRHSISKTKSLSPSSQEKIVPEVKPGIENWKKIVDCKLDIDQIDNGQGQEFEIVFQDPIIIKPHTTVFMGFLHHLLICFKSTTYFSNGENINFWKNSFFCQNFENFSGTIFAKTEKETSECKLNGTYPFCSPF